MKNNTYDIVNKEFDGINIVGFTLKNSENNTKIVSKADTIRLARNEKINEVKAVLDTDTGEYLLSIQKGIENIPSIIKSQSIRLNIVCKLINNNGKCVGYKAKDDTGKSYKLSTNKTWELASKGIVIGCQGKIVNDTKAIFSTDEFQLSNIPKVFI